MKKSFKKWAFIMALILILGSSFSSFAASPRIISVVPKLTFSGTTANCSATVIANSSSDDISITVKLWQGTKCLKTWNDSADGYLSFKGTTSVTKGKTYKLTVDATINGVKQSTATVSAKCN